MISDFIVLILFVISDTAFFAYAGWKINSYRNSISDVQMKDVMKTTIYTLCGGIVGFYMLSIDLVRELGYYGNDMLYAVLFLTFLSSAASIYRASKIFFQSYTHVGHEKVGNKLLYGYIPFFGIPMLLLLTVGEIVSELEVIIGMIILGFYFWNFVSDTIMDFLCYNKVYRLQYTIGSDVSASRDAQTEIKKLLLWKFVVMLLAFILVLGLFVIADKNVMTYFTVFSMGLLIPTSGLLMMRRLILVEKLLKIPMRPTEEIQETNEMADLGDGTCSVKTKLDKMYPNFKNKQSV
eukprot:NODE_353_length_10269_cov_0.284759.p4 type:complete len:293 gc:universal NODE_353_length_10269_cov_0.284759:9303-10181(+)